MINKILIVDDSPVARMMLKSCLPKDKGYEIYEAQNGEEGIRQFKEISPGLTFMDLTMPVLDGYGSIAGIREISEDALIVVMSADIQAKASERVKSMGVFDILKKPPRPPALKELLAKIESSLPEPAECKFSELETFTLQEVMNIAFGNAAADLAEVIDIYLELNAPDIHIINIGDMPDYLKEKMDAGIASSFVITQNFFGDFSGYGVLLLPEDAGKSMLSVLEAGEYEEREEDRPVAGQEKDVLLEIGNILIGACVGKISELLKTFVTYNPPRIINEKGGEYDSFINSFDPYHAAIIMETVFRFEQVDIKGQFLIITHHEAMEWLRNALNDFLEPYCQ